MFVLIVTHPGRTDSYGQEESDHYQIQIFSTMQLAQNHAQNYQRSRLYGVEIQTITVDNANDTIDL